MRLLDTIYISFQRLLIPALCILIAGQAYGQEWEQRASLPGVARHHPVTFSLDGKGYVVTGGSATGRLRDFYQYDPVTDDWTQLRDFPGGSRSFAYGTTYNGKAYMGFGTQSQGNNFNGLNDWWSYDPDTNIWEPLADCRCTGRAHPAMVAVDGKIFVGMGNDGFGADLNDWWEYDIATDDWSQKPDLPGSIRHHPYYFAIDGYAYVGFGHHSVDIFNDMYRYDPATEEWDRMADLPAEGRVAGTQFSYGGHGYLLSGDGDDHSFMDTGEFWQYDPVTDSWTDLPPHPGISRWAPGSFLIDNVVYFVAGETTGLERDMWAYELPLMVNTTEATKSEVSISPNPATDVVAIDRADLVTSIAIHAIDGRQVMHIDNVSSTIDISDLEPGQYAVIITESDKTTTTRLSIVR
jgi:N-acetylneuraminic acid mutarotase